MSILAIQLPPRERLGARSAGLAAADGQSLPGEWPFVLSDEDGRQPIQSGLAAAAALPKADRVVLVLADMDVSWHRLDIPKAPSNRLRAALLGVMEEALLEEEDTLHLALAPDAAPGRKGWVAVTHRPRLQAALAVLEGAGLSVERVVVAQAPGTSPRGHFHTAFQSALATDYQTDFRTDFQTSDYADGATPWLTLSGPDSALCLRLLGNLSRALLPGADSPVQWTASPAAAAGAERWLAAPVALLTDAERVMEAVRAGDGQLNLRQFDLAARHRGTRALREAAQRFMSREWRPVRWGLAAVVAVQLIGLNLQAMQQRQAIADKRAAQVALLKQAHPGVRAVLDAPLQMQRETERLRTSAGRASASDLEALLSAAAGAWPDGQGPAQMLRFESGRLTVATAGWAEPQLSQFRDRLRSAGYAAELAEGRVTISHLAGKGTA